MESPCRGATYCMSEMLGLVEQEVINFVNFLKAGREAYNLPVVIGLQLLSRLCHEGFLRVTPNRRTVFPSPLPVGVLFVAVPISHLPSIGSKIGG